jgi:NitT/TauT family transport system substrate-binding protein
MRSIQLALAAIVAAAFAYAPGAFADPLKIRTSYVVPVANWASLLPAKADLMTNLNKTYSLDVTRFQGTPPMITALASNQLDIGDLAYSSFALAVQNAGLTDLRIISDDFQDGVPGYYTDQYFVLNDSGIKTVEDLKGKVLATNAGGSAVDIAMRAMLRKHGLEDKRDYTVIEAPFPAMRAMLAEKKVDMVAAVLPFADDPALKKISRVLFTTEDAIGVSQFSMWTARKGFIDKNRAAMVDFMEDTLRIVHWYLDPANHKDVMEICARLVKQPADRFGWVFTKEDNYRDPNMKPDLAALQRNVDLTHDMGFIKSSIDVGKYTDLSLVEEAAKRLK